MRQIDSATDWRLLRAQAYNPFRIDFIYWGTSCTHTRRCLLTPYQALSSTTTTTTTITITAIVTATPHLAALNTWTHVGGVQVNWEQKEACEPSPECDCLWWKGGG
ncbi:hypothetical protein E2C01_071333 [Portunus trituberculatus]|uniref:Uncharacterized protein n=1 Tax=Portunus trituberculatus TaxID=210409 RepID=A0A5B7I7Q3_PORTR|nr:hypothetical protein [Portunus trituberculatus]